MRSSARSIKRYIHKASAHLVAGILQPGAVYDADNFRLWEKRGYHITPTHFYSPIPNTHDLEHKASQSSMPSGVDLRPTFQLKLLQEAFVAFSPEYNDFPAKQATPQTFYLDNDAFSGIDPHVYHCMARLYKPKTIVEVGSGYSTLLGRQAALINEKTQYVCVDPWPRNFIAKGVSDIEFIRQKVEDLDLDVFQRLQCNDILFIDSSHVVRTASDVCFVILEVLPRLAKGVIIHFHDIFIPFDYPNEWIIEQQRFWTEQYLLQAYLTENNHAEVLFASHYMAQEYPDMVRQAFPNALWIGGGSFWIRKC